MSGATAAGAATIAAAIQATKASGVVVRLEPRDFKELLSRQEGALVVHAVGGVMWKNYQYLLAYRGLAFFTKSPTPIELPRHTELVMAKSIWVPA